MTPARVPGNGSRERFGVANRHQAVLAARQNVLDQAGIQSLSAHRSHHASCREVGDVAFLRANDRHARARVARLRPEQPVVFEHALAERCGRACVASSGVDRPGQVADFANGAVVRDDDEEVLRLEPREARDSRRARDLVRSAVHREIRVVVSAQQSVDARARREFTTSSELP
jgi:hypothetical protein